MKEKNKLNNKLPKIWKAAIFIVLAATIAFLLPTENKFKYEFELGKPWAYELMTAPFDFPIYKGETQLEQDKTELLKDFSPYYNRDSAMQISQLKKFLTDNQSALKYKTGIIDKFSKRFLEIYTRGIMGQDEWDRLSLNLDSAESNIKLILPDRIIKVIPVNTVFTPKTAYEMLVQLSPEILKSCNLNHYLKENLVFDSIKTELARNEITKNLSITSGMVQFGERIIDRGEIINGETYQILNSLKLEFDKRKTTIQRSTLMIFGEIFIVSGLIFLFFLYVYLFRPRIFDNNNDLLFISMLILLVVGLATSVVKYTNTSYYLIPYALLPIIIRVFYDSRTALFAHIISTMIVALIVEDSFKFLLMQIVAGMAAVSSLKDMTQRSQLAQTALIVLGTYILMHISLELITEGDLFRVQWRPLIFYSISSAFMLFGYLLIYIFEKIFGLISAITLVELTNINSDIMLEFAEKAPGTFQHTLQVSNLATEAAKKIGCNSLLVRTGALYHDIGKMKNPEYFTENQMGGHNPLLDMQLEEAAAKVISHVTDGVEIAKKFHLPEQIINFITTHHGTSKTKYFYNSFINANPGVIPNESAYTYPGPIPNSKETAILMMADAVEARSRSLSIYNEQTISDMVEQMIDGQIADGQFKEAPISFRDVESVKKIFKDKIKNMYHTRITYPEISKHV